MHKALRNAALWVRDWVLTAVHDPEFWSYRIATIRPLPMYIRRRSVFEHWPGYLEIRVYPGRPKFQLHHPREWTDWGISTIDYAYPDCQAIDYDEVPF